MNKSTNIFVFRFVAVCVGMGVLCPGYIGVSLALFGIPGNVGNTPGLDSRLVVRFFVKNKNKNKVATSTPDFTRA